MQISLSELEIMQKDIFHVRDRSCSFLQDQIVSDLCKLLTCFEGEEDFINISSFLSRISLIFNDYASYELILS